VDKLRETLIEVMSGYAGTGLNVVGYLTWNEAKTVFAIVDFVTERDGRRSADSSLIVRLQRDWILIERDMNSDILMEALVEAGIPRQKIICVYAGETLTDDDFFKDLLLQHLEAYAASISGYFTRSDANNLFIVTRRTNGKRKSTAETDIIARFADGKVIIEHIALNDKKLLDALVAAGIPREKIVLAYAGETVAPAPEPIAK
jgi:hypothetical protein